MKKAVVVGLSLMFFVTLNVFAADSSFIDICKTGGIAAIQSMLTTGKVSLDRKSVV